MSLSAASFVSSTIDSKSAGEQLAREVAGGLDGTAPAVVLLFSTVNHDAQALLDGVRAGLGANVPVIGCSAQGIMGRGLVEEDGYWAGALALGGSSLEVSVAHVEGIHSGTREKGAALGRSLGGSPRAVILLYDPLCGADAGALLDGLFAETKCPIYGAGAGQPHGPMVETHQYFCDRVLEASAVAVALEGSFGLDTGICHGTVPVGIDLTVTKTDGPTLLELDGRPALDVWAELCGSARPHAEQTTGLAVGIPAGPRDGEPYLVHAAFGFDAAARGVVMPTEIPTGTRIMLHHRTVYRVIEGAARMAADLQQRLAGKKVRAALGFECGARTEPYLGREATVGESFDLQQAIGPDAAWLGMLAWSEIYPLGGRPALHNYTYPLLVLSE